jgi:hypothetical protein
MHKVSSVVKGRFNISIREIEEIGWVYDFVALVTSDDP